jgi:hypothetical protein
VPGSETSVSGIVSGKVAIHGVVLGDATVTVTVPVALVLVPSVATNVKLSVPT